jgi:imidazolonepropionase-like amidohydrolase
LLAAALAAAGCASTGSSASGGPKAGGASAASAVSVPFPSTYHPLPSEPTLIAGATVLTGTGERIDDGAVLMSGGRIAAVGRRGEIEAPAGARVIDAAGRWVTPGLIDVHSHLGVYASPGVPPHEDGNEATDPVTPQVWAEHSVWPQDPGFPRALAGGVTTLQILPGSANLIGGRSVTLKNVPARTMQAMKLPGAPHGLKMACGENPKRVYGNRGRAPSTRMGNVAGYRAAWIEADAYRQKRQRQREGGGSGTGDDKPLERDLGLETLAGVLDGEILVHNHCYRADEMAVMLDLARELGYRVTAFHHATEAYKVADLLAGAGVCAAVWADWWGFKMEAFDGIRENAALVDHAGGCAIIHSDSERGIQRLNQEAAKAMAAGWRMGLELPRERAIRWITSNPARALGIGEETGALEPGKAADLVVWSGDPFSVYTRAERVFIDGALVYDRDDPERQPVSDFEIGTTGPPAGLPGGPAPADPASEPPPASAPGAAGAGSAPGSLPEPTAGSPSGAPSGVER